MLESSHVPAVRSGIGNSAIVMERPSHEGKTLMRDVRSFQTSSLKKVETRVTTSSGRQLLESKDNRGNLNCRILGSCGSWFVRDCRPDLHIGRVLQDLYVGSQDVAQDLGVLRQNRITHVLNVASWVDNLYADEIIYKKLNIRDIPSANIRQHFESCFDFIDEGRETGRVFVHCNAGISRASTIVIGYLMSRFGLRFDEAFLKVKEARPCICPNEGFRRQLKEYENELFRDYRVKSDRSPRIALSDK
ncbi:dual specificity protein phosphatase 19-like [Centruroides sculpturatus]|uniref:dual specificity protein phosphatase 19-like n=1 Tax=Centruroides sculpturatus TaxID=218467 RepID=UPI000C6D0744|nr:dual specificity protein phosphatase 19-like [Centruroides sculpturatus]